MRVTVSNSVTKFISVSSNVLVPWWKFVQTHCSYFEQEDDEGEFKTQSCGSGHQRDYNMQVHDVVSEHCWASCLQSQARGPCEIPMCEILIKFLPIPFSAQRHVYCVESVVKKCWRLDVFTTSMKLPFAKQIQQCAVDMRSCPVCLKMIGVNDLFEGVAIIRNVCLSFKTVFVELFHCLTITWEFRFLPS